MSSNAVTLVVPSRFAGPPGTPTAAGSRDGSRGCSGRTGPVQVTLREPVPLEVALEVRVDGQGTASLGFGGALIAEAAAGALTEVVDPVDHATAQAATKDYAGWAGHPFPGCFVCGPDRPPPDGLGVFPGRLDGRPDTVATTWLPDQSLAGDDERLSAAPRLGRPGLHQRLVQRPGRPAQGARPDHRRGRRCPRIGEPCVVVGRHLRDDGRKTFTASTAYDSDGRVLGRAEALWIALRTGPAKSL